MTVSLERPGDAPTAASLAVYAHAIRRGGVAADDPALPGLLGLAPETVDASIAQLIDLHLLRRELTDDWWRLVPVSPDVAAAALISPIGEEIHRQRAMISQIQGRLNAFQSHYETHREPVAAPAGVESIQDPVELSGQLHLAAERCRREFAGFRPDGLLPLEQVAAMAARGVAVRLLLAHAQRPDLRMRAALKEILAAGGEVRTVGRVPRQVIIVDDAVAFLLHGGGERPAGVAIRHAETVLLLRELVETTWAAAEPYEAAEFGYHEVAHDLQRTIVELLASGLTDEVIARHLGMSVRTCRRHIATVLTNLDAVSRFQAGALAALTGLLDARRLRVGRPAAESPGGRGAAESPGGRGAADQSVTNRTYGAGA
jgi:DNA-binding CsgD family transcriptional regulator